MTALSEIRAAVPADRVRLRPGSPAWQREMTASKVAAVLGVSPWESRFSLWYRMAGAVPSGPETPAQRRGHYLEDAVARVVRDEHGLGQVVRGGTWRNRERPWQVATPDRIAVRAGAADPLVRDDLAIVECKTEADWDEWGPDGSDEVPPYVRVQVLWQMDTLGIPTAHVGVLLPRLAFRVYTVVPAPGEVEWMREECLAFLRSLAALEPPDVDAHSETYVVLRELHPEIDGTEVEVPAPLAGQYVRAVLGRRAAGEEYQLATNLMAEHLGGAHKATYGGVTLADRRSKNGGRPYVNPATRLPVIPEEEPETPARLPVTLDPSIPDGEIHVVGATTVVIPTIQEETAP